MKIAFLNLPWFSLEDTPNPEEKRLRRGIRAGSRWPFTVPASKPPGSANVPLGEYVPFPWFLASAAAWTQRAIPDAQVIVRDSIARYESVEEFNVWWLATKPDYVIVETGSPCWENDLKWIRAMKQSLPSVQIAVCGPNARSISEAALIDAFLLGEYDKLVAKFVHGSRGVLDFDLLTREELKTAPHPLFDEPVAYHYADSNPKGTLWPELTVWASRGCAYRCNFCSFPATMTNDDPTGKGKRTIRFYDPSWIEGFIRHRISVSAHAGRPLRSIRFDGDTENSSDPHTKAICAVMRRIGLPWTMMCRADTSSESVWREMADSGCVGVKLGFESGSQRIVNEVVGKKLDLKAAEETALYLRHLGMGVHGTFMVGHPSETTEEKHQTLALIRRLYATGAINSHQLSGTATIDGTPLSHAAITDPNFIRDSDGAHKAETILHAP